MRSFLVAGFFTLFLIVSIPLYIICVVIGLINRKAGVVCSQQIVNVAFRIILLTCEYFFF